jgi:signal transduction histidine kinase
MGGRRHLVLPFIILVVGLVASLAVSVQLGRIAAERSQARFDGLVENVRSAINARIDTQTALLRSLAGLFAADDAVSPEEFHRYVAKLEIDRRYASVLGMAYARFGHDEAEKHRIETYMRTEGGKPDFRIWPAGKRESYSALLYIEPQRNVTPATFGFDILTEPVGREALLRAARTGGLSMSGRIPPIPTVSAITSPLFITVLPIYQNNPAEAALPANRRTLRGWLQIPLRAEPLFRTVFGPKPPRDVAVAIYAGAPRRENLLYQTGELPSDPLYRTAIPILIAGQRWTADIRSTEAFDADSPLALPLTVGAAGAIVTLLMSALALLQARTVSRTERRVEQRTAELSAANARLIEESASREAAESQLRQMQKMEAIGQLTGGVAHDFNNMLAVVMGSLDIARRKIGDPARLEKLLDTAMEGTTRAATLTQRLLAFARQQALSPAPTDTNRLIGGMTELLQRTLGETVWLNPALSGDLWPCFVDAGQLENAIVNLAVNARDAMTEGGALVIATANLRLDASKSLPGGDLAPGDYVTIAVTDTGIGMSSEVMAKAFDPFFTTKSLGRGTGLGLSQVFGFAKQTGGHIALSSEPGRGTTVTLYLPRFAGAIEPDRSKGPHAATNAGARSAEVILTVEDDARVRQISVDALNDLGYTVLEAASGRQAIDVIEQHPEITLIFTDVVMPDMDGPALARVVRQRWPAIRLLFTTGYAPNVLAGSDTLDPDADLLRKPFTIDQLAGKIRAALDG